MKVVKWICLLSPLIAYPFFALVGFAYGMSFEFSPPPTEMMHTRAALFATTYAVIWLVYLFASFKWHIRTAAWIYLVYWVCAALIFRLIRADITVPALRPLIYLLFPLIGFSERHFWEIVVHIIMLLLGVGVIIYLYVGKITHKTEGGALDSP